LVKSDPLDIPRAIRLSRMTMRKIRQNLFWAFLYNTVLIPVAALGYLNPLLAGAAMAMSSVSVMANSLTLTKAQL
jgi:Cu+-exporting ATPase